MTTARSLIAADSPTANNLRYTSRHPLGRPVGTMLLLDFQDDRSNPYASGTVASATTFSSLGDSSSVSVVASTATTNNITNTGNALTTPEATSGANQSISVGSAGTYNTNIDFHLHTVFQLPNDTMSTSYGAMLTLGTANNNSMFWLDLGTANRAPRVFIKSIAGSTSTQTITGFAPGSPQIVDVVASGTSAYVYLNGAKVKTLTVAGIPDLSTATFKILGNSAGAKLWTVMLQDLSQVAAYEAAVGNAFTYETAVADAYAVSSSVSYT